MSTRPALAVVEPVDPHPDPAIDPQVAGSLAVVPWHTDAVLRAYAALQAASATATARLARARGDDRGQSTAEYALVILGAAAVAALLVAWASQTNKVSRLLDVILDNIINRFR